MKRVRFLGFIYWGICIQHKVTNSNETRILSQGYFLIGEPRLDTLLPSPWNYLQFIISQYFVRVP